MLPQSIEPPAAHPLKPLVLCVLLALACGGDYVQAQSTVQDEDDPASTSANVTELDIIEVTGQYETRDEAGRNDVFAKDVSNVYMGKEEIERYKGTSVGDLFKGLNGVYSGDSRNSGAVDPNIRGLQGGGRIPLTVDGTEQSTSVWMSLAGVANRNYLDPNMISSIMVEKGPSMTRGVRTGIGGSVQVKTLEVDDIVRPGETFGFELKTETATNAVKPDESSFSNFGKDYRDIPGAYRIGYGVSLPFGRGSDMTPRKGSSGKDLDFNDTAWRVAIANKHEHFDLLGAYSYRKRGNYFSGKGGSQGYETDAWRDDLLANLDTNTVLEVERLPTQYVANYFLPGQEVTNTSSELESILLKGSVRLPGNQSLDLSYMRTDHLFGESIPFIISYAVRNSENINGIDAVQAQFPYSNVKQNTYNLGYAWKPEGSRWIDISAGIWVTQSDAWRHQNGDATFGLPTVDTRDSAWDDYVKCHARSNQAPSSAYCAAVPTEPPDKQPNTNGRYNIVPRALQITSDDRLGVNVSNKFKLHSTLDLTVSGDFTREKLKQWNGSEAAGNDRTEGTSGIHYYAPRAGTREQYNFAFNFNWTATSWLQLSAGYRYSDYWAHDDKTAEQRKHRVDGYQVYTPLAYRRFTYKEIMSDADAADFDDRQRSFYDDEIDWYVNYEPDMLADFLAEFPTADDYVNDGKINGVRYQTSDKEILVPYTGNHKGFAANNPFLNGTIDLNEMVATTQSPDGVAKKYGDSFGHTYVSGAPPPNPWQAPEKIRGHAWAPQFGATAFLTDNIRVYARYAQFSRFPSIFESTQMVRGALGSPLRGSAASRPERAYNWEVGYAHDLTRYFPGLNYTDFRINYFNSTIRDYMDRDYNFNIVHFDKKKLSGIEVQTRIDSGRYFAGFGGSYRLEQKMCDKDYASFIDPIYNRTPACVDGGFPGTFAHTSLQPKYSLDLDFGARLLDRKLEVGSRMTYHSAYENKSERNMSGMSRVLNRPYSWNPIWVFDAYAVYRVHDHLSIDLGITNITNRYYIDPLARVSQPAPGRAIRMGLTARF
ncbi:receptor [Ventosimonas gracilis]|uniref:Receptor n=1 Tax=Ventosimonas gracilis TaxID=1680762 RepID=A0A139SVN1_9GAMM|nr:TonB-dependent receptor [Ventosimonas gracilis]KXU38491.1 receptor [Ventosimonas gracilis]